MSEHDSESSRTPGEQGSAPAGSVETDKEAGAARTSPGDPPGSRAEDGDAEAGTSGSAHGVSVGATESLEGSSEESNAVTGVRSPVPAPDVRSASSTGQQVSDPRRPSGPDGEVAPE